MRVGMGKPVKRLAEGHIEAKFLPQFPFAGFGKGFAVLPLSTRKLPESPEQSLLRSLLYVQATLRVFYDGHDNIVMGHGLFFG